MTMDDSSSESWVLVNEDARQWASQYAGALVSGLTSTSAQIVQGGLSDFIAGRLTYSELIDLLTPTFGADRADMLATTEVTRAFAEGSRMAWRRTGVIEWWTWTGAHDERECGACGSVDGETFSMDAPMPPGHPRCRCIASPALSADG